MEFKFYNAGRWLLFLTCRSKHRNKDSCQNILIRNNWKSLGLEIILIFHEFNLDYERNTNIKMVWANVLNANSVIHKRLLEWLKLSDNAKSFSELISGIEDIKG